MRHARFSLALLFMIGCEGVAPELDGLHTDGDATSDTAAPLSDPAFEQGAFRQGLGPVPVRLGRRNNRAQPGAYVLLAKTGITNVTGSSISLGQVGLSPAAASFITGFSLVADPTNVFATSVSVVAPGKVFAADYAPPTPDSLLNAVLGMETAYTDAAGRINPDFLDLASGDLGGLVLAPGLYTWGSTVTIPTDVTISGASNDVWIFQIANDLDLSAATSVLLSGGAQARNIFWQVAGNVTIHENAHFEGIILSQTAVTLQTNATMNGRVLAQTLIALDDNTVVAP